ncbi:hypothetical protein F4806DRAFT_505153 [Annulohypoxylon nitens]|nr:hypothetical protein F4806DRAFT_505153 [Annulohypoxylon nitens]
MSNPWSDREPVPKAHVALNAIWPDRLLHVPTMKSYRNNGQNVYGNPNKQHVIIHGVDWEIPSIDPEYFTPDGFRLAMERAAQGNRKSPCEWLWVDIACIPQQPQDGKESKESIRLRNQEIGRQAAIFSKAQENTANLVNCVSPFGSNKKVDLGHAARLLKRLDQGLVLYTQWLNPILSHPWFKSLWTLQEMILRHDACFLFEDGLLGVNKGSGTRAKTMQNSQIMPYFSDNLCLHDLEREFSFLDYIINEPFHPWGNMGRIETKINEKPRSDSEQILSVAEMYQRLDGMLRLLKELGFGVPSVFHAPYSAAQHRRVGHLLDRIYGIVQTYGINCNPDPPGATLEEKLEALEDDFGIQLVSQSPINSQLFIHTSCSGRQPRRSWLVTQGCKVDEWWEAFEADDWGVIINLTDYFRTNTEHTEGPHVEFKGQAWYLDSFVQENSKDIFRPIDEDDSPSLYNGILLDYHVSRTVLGHEIDYFTSYDDLKQAVEKLDGHYRRDSLVAKGQHSLQVASLGCSFDPSDSYVHHVGVILAPSHTEDRNVSDEVEPEFWVRVGLVRWIEHYKGRDPRKKHPNLPLPHEFQCTIK